MDNERVVKQLISHLASRIYKNNRRNRFREKIATEEKKTRHVKTREQFHTRHCTRYKEAEYLIFINQEEEYF